MALPKPQLNGDVLDYDKLQTDRLNGEADYIIEIGSTAREIRENGGRIKWQ